MLGVEPLLGRMFASGEDQKGLEHKVILSFRLWQRRYNGDRAVLGKTMTLNGESYTVIGVMPPEFKFAPFWATHAELWVPLAFGDRIHDRGGNSLRVFARLKSDTSLNQARAEIAAITNRLERQEPGSNRNVRVTPLKENVVGRIETPLLMLMGAVGFVLLIACANVAHMLLARTTERQKEIAVRTALGASRSRVLGQFLTESLLLTAAGALVGLPLAYGGTRLLVALNPVYIPRVDMVRLDTPVVLFLSAISMLTTVIFGMAPAMQATRGNPIGALNESGRAGTGGIVRNRLRIFLMVSEFALAFVLMAGAGLMIRSFAALQSADAGFNPHNVLSMVVSVAGAKESEPGHRAIFYRQLLDRVRELPGVESAGGINHLPLAGDMWGQSFRVQGRPEPLPGKTPQAVYRIVMPGYFETMRLPLRSGRAIGETDDERAPGVVVINERAASVYWPGENPVGKRIELSGPARELTIIGVASNAKQLDWAAAIPYPEIYLAGRQSRDFLEDGRAASAYLTLVIRTAGNPADLAAAVKDIVWSFDRNLPVSEVLTMDGVVGDATAQPRFEMQLFTLFAAVALLLSVAGIYGVINYSISRRTREIGIRMSLGASRSEVLRMVLRQGMVLAIAGTTAGLVGTLLLSKMMAGMVYGVMPNDPATLMGAAAVLGFSAMLAAWVPARKAARIEPMAALRHE